jgi:hypothetical protein
MRPIMSTQFILSPNFQLENSQHEELYSNITPIRRIIKTTEDPRNMIYALEEFRHESRFTPGSEYTINQSWARKPTIRRKMKTRLQEIVPDKDAIAKRVVQEN